MSLWKHLLGIAEYFEGSGYGHVFAANGEPLPKYELTLLIGRYGVERSLKYFKGMEHGFNEFLRKELGVSKVGRNDLNPYQLGELMAEKKALIPTKALRRIIAGRKDYDAKAALMLMADGYNDRLRSIEKETKKLGNKFLKDVRRQEGQNKPYKHKGSIIEWTETKRKNPRKKKI